MRKTLLLLFSFLLYPIFSSASIVTWDVAGPVEAGRWVVAPNGDHATRPLRYLRTLPHPDDAYIPDTRVPVGSPCYDDTRPGEQCGPYQWRLWREDGKPDGRPVGQVFCQHIVDDPTRNLLKGAAALASSQEAADKAPGMAIDGDPATRWSSAWDDPQWLTVDMGAPHRIGRVVLNWEAAYGKAYQVQLSDNATDWRTVYDQTAGGGGVEDISFTPTTARYVRLYGTARATKWGYSLFEVEAYSP